MNTKIKFLIKHRETIFCAIVAIVICSFTLSYAINNIAVFLLIPLFFLDTKSNISKKVNILKKHKIVILFALLFLAQCIGYFYSENKAFAIRRIEVMLPLLFAPVVIFTETITQKNKEALLNFIKYAITLTFIGLIFSHVFILKKNLNTFVHFTIEEQLGISQFYLSFIIILPILIALKAIFEKKALLLNITLLLVLTGTLLLLGNKTALFFLTLLGGIYILLLFKRKQATKAVFLTVIALFGLLAVSQTNIVKNRLEVFVKTTDLELETIITKNKFTQTKNTFEHRILINYLAGQEIIKTFPFGVGTGDFVEVLTKRYQGINFKRGISGKLNNHNQYMSEFLKTGILGGLTFILLLYFLLKNTDKKQFFYPVFIWFFIVACFFESYLYRQHGVIILAFLIPFLYKIEELNNNKLNI